MKKVPVAPWMYDFYKRMVEEDREVIAMAKDWAEECCRCWFHKADNGEMRWADAIDGAIREALEKAAEVAKNHCVCEVHKPAHGWQCPAVNAIRALGAK